jgi:hypothetical protein
MVLDKDQTGNKAMAARLAHIKVAPPLGTVPRLEAKRKTRRPNDQKVLNTTGLEALERMAASNKRGELCKDSIVWRLEYRCRGTPLCDMPARNIRRGCCCSLGVVYSASVQHVHEKIVLIRVTGDHGVQHSATHRWDPTIRAKVSKSKAPVQLAELKRRAKDVLALECDVIRARRADSGQSLLTPVSVSPPMPQLQGALADNMRQQLGNAQYRFRVLKRGLEAEAVRQNVSKATHEKILELSSMGINAGHIQMRLGEDAPRREYIRGVINKERRRTRLQTPPYEAVHTLALADQGRIILYLVADPKVTVPDNSTLPVGATHLVMIATAEMVDFLAHATGIGLDAKWRTRDDGGCVFAIGAFTQQTHAKARETRRVEFEAGYVGNRYQIVSITLSNVDNYW